MHLDVKWNQPHQMVNLKRICVVLIFGCLDWVHYDLSWRLTREQPIPADTSKAAHMVFENPLVCKSYEDSYVDWRMPSGFFLFKGGRQILGQHGLKEWGQSIR